MNHKLKNERIRRRLVSILSCIVVFCTTYALILPAVTLERDDIVYYCGKEEHQHTDECYESPKDRPLCGLKEGEMVDGHVHDESCYKTEMVLDCLEDHEHTDECYKEEKTLVCDKEEGAQEHKHSSKCFLSTEPLCGKEVHTHSRECESNKGLKETKEDWEHSIPAKLKDTAAERMVQIALSQKDYKEVKENFELDEEGHEQYYTRYGEWYGRPYEDWNVMFVSFVLRYAGIKNEQIPYGHDWNEWIEDLTKKQLFADEGYLPKDGDLIFIKDKEDENVPDKEIRNYAGIVTDIENRKIVVGDLNGQVKEITLDDKEYETNAYVAMIESDAKDDVPADKEENDDNETNEEERPDEETGKEEANEEETDPIEFRMPEQFEIENEDFTLKLTPRVFDEDVQEENQEQTEEDSEETNEEGLKIKKFSLNEENIQDKIDAENELTKEELEQIAQANEEQKKEDEDKPLLTVQLEKIDEQAQTSEEEQAEIEQLKEQSLENVDQDNLLDLSFYKLRFFANDQEVDLKDQKFDAELTPTEQFVEKYDTTKDLEDVAPEAEVGTTVSILNTKKQFNLKLINEEEQNNSVLINKNYANNPIAISINATELLGIDIHITPNPEFEVEIYGRLLKNELATYEDLNQDKTQRQNSTFQVIDMTQIPEKFDGAHVKYKDYKNVNGKFNKVLSSEPEEIYSLTKYKFHQAPSLDYFNKLNGISSYNLKEIWIKPQNKNDWDKFTYNSDDLSQNILFTNSNLRNDLYDDTKPSQFKGKYYLITEGTKIRLVFEETKSNAQENTTFWDYDFYDNNLNIHTQNGGRVGINNENNYISTQSPTLVLGNKYISQKFYSNDTSVNVNKNGKNINQSAGNLEFTTTQNVKDKNGNNQTINVQRSVRSHPIFGLVQNSLDTNGNIQYNVNAPKLFDDGEAKFGKSKALSGSLKFNRTGDTYSLYGVNGPNEYRKDTLDQFTTGDAYTPEGEQQNRFHYNGFWPLDNYNKSKNYGSQNNQPTLKYNDETYGMNGTYPSDDGQDHNTLFGMKYQVEFNLDKNYTGPLRYFFYGDDDMWVYLDNQLICDIGGVHQSIGAEVDIREALGDSLLPGKHTLTIYYLERGQAGSSCYMEYTLPNVVSKTPNNATGELKIEKQTNDPDPNKDYEFEIELKDPNNKELAHEYALTVYTKSTDGGNDIIDENRSNVTFHSRGKILLKNNQYAVIKYLPLGTKYTITENVEQENDSIKISHCQELGSACIITDSETKPINGKYIITGQIPSSGSSLSQFVKVFNHKYFELPETGSLGIDPPLIAGSAGVMTTSFYALTLKRKGRWRKRKR
ncbi:fibro-slime domain-containing protein [uncultured Dubosiella sp.]|uniref:DUF7601 domain-containing protein n=4 Tax=uncultured Dubosiella sp. TaxID=1937011 RepID=UPI0025CEACA6|nr:fibro-slime domain-containing protein [uncultured Dubosiella sp.]